LLDQNPSITDILYLGGDGSINYFVNNVDLARVKANIYLAQSGSGNDFMRTLKPLHQGEMTIGSAETDVKNVKFINGCGLGLDGHVGFFVNQDKKKNKMSYFINTLRALRVYKPTPMEVIVDGVKHSYERTYIVAIQNGKYFGGGMKVAPLGDPRTEEFEVMVAHTLPRWLVFPLFLTIYAGLHVKIKKYVATFRGKDIVVHSVDPKYFQAEGEVLSGVSSIHATAASKRMIHSFEKAPLLAAKKA
jgi:diacylglycerol kinase (ATP)